MASHLLESNFNVYEIHRPLYEEQDFIYLKLLSKVIDLLYVSNNFKVVYTIITPSILNDVGADSAHVDGITEYIRNIKNVEISFMIYQKDPSTIRINFRSSGIYTVDDIASSFGGGGA
jgi:phosphoesterase RecJ-like protein